MADTPTLELRIRDNAEDAVGGLLHLANALAALKAHLGNLSGLAKVSTDIENFATKCNKAFNTDLVSNINNVSHALDDLTRARDISLPDLSSVKNAQQELGNIANSSTLEGMEMLESRMGEAGGAAENLANSINPVNEEMEDLAAEAPSVLEALYEIAINSKLIEERLGGTSNSMSEVSDKMDESADSAKSATREIQEHAMSLKDVTSAAKRAISPLDKVISAFKRILFYRVIRSVLKEIAKGFSEGIKNVREYSKAISGSFDKAMTSAEDTLFKLKNSLGAALAPAIEAVIPAIQTLVNWFITLINYVNQFIALISGKTSWTRAIDASAASFEKTKKAAKGAAKEVKNLLAGFDELNIIQSESGDSGGSGAGAFSPDYTKAFEEVYEFDKKIRDIVNWLKENAELIKTIVGEIGAAILAWRLSQAFSGILGKLFGLAAMGLVIKIVWDMVSYFDNKYLETGDPGWLVANVVTTAIGALATKAIIDKVIGTGWGTVAAGVTLAFSAAADIVANINHTDVSALSEQSVVLSILAAMKMGVAGYMIAKFFGMNIPQALMIGGGAALVTFGAAVGIKAISVAIDTSDFGTEYVKSMVISSVSGGLGAGLLLKAGGAGFARIISGSAGAALLVLGAMVGIRAVHEKVDAGWTLESIKDTALASAGVGIGAGLLAFAVGAPAGIAGIIGGAAALATVGVIIGVAAILSSDKNKVQWGNARLTSDQIQEYVNTTYFTVDVPTRVNLIDTRINNATQAQSDLRTSALGVFDTLNILKLGVDEESTLNLLLDQVLGAGHDGAGGLVNSVKESIKTKRDLLQLSLSIMPVLDKQGTDISKELAVDNIAGWDKVTAQVEKLGNDLADLLIDPDTKKLKENLDAMEKKAVSDIIETMNNISNAVSGAHTETEALTNLNIGLSDMTQGTADEVIKQFAKYYKELKDGYTRLQYEAAAGILARARALEAIGDTEGAEKAMEEYKTFLEGIPDAVNGAVEKASQSGKELVTSQLEGMFGGLLKDYDTYVAELGLVGSVNMAEHLSAMIADIFGLSKEALEEVGINPLDFMPDTIKSQFLTDIAKEYGLEIADEIAKSIGSEVPEKVRTSIEESVKQALREKALQQQEDAWRNDKDLAAQVAGMKEVASLTVIGPVEQVMNGLDTAAKEAWNYVSQGTIDVTKFVLDTSEKITKEVDAQREEVNDIFEEAIENTNKKYKLEELQKEIEKQQKVVDNYNGAITKLWEAVMHPENYTDKQNATHQQLFNDNSSTSIFAMYESAVGRLEELKQAAESLREDIEGGIDVPEVDVKPLTDNFSWAEKVIIEDIKNVLEWLQYLGSYKVNVEFDISGGGKVNTPFTTNMLKASGGFVGTGEMFVAREAGPELVGRIGSRTAVANNDQIVAGVANGVAAGQGEQNALLRQQNDLLRQMLAKSGRVEAVPSAAWGKFVKRSAEMYASNTGM